MQYLLDEELLSGTHDVSLTLRPERAVRMIQESDGHLVQPLMSYLCQVWGGQANPLLPVAGQKVPSAYLGDLYCGEYDLVDTSLREVLESITSGTDPDAAGATLALPEPVDGSKSDPPTEGDDRRLPLPEQIEQGLAWDVPALVVAASRPKDQWRTIRVCELAADDPWAPIYTATLGYLPEAPDVWLSKGSLLSETVAFDDVVPIERESVTGSLGDLIERLRGNRYLTPRMFAGALLVSGLQPDTSFLGTKPILPSPYHERRAAGPNIIIVTTPGSVADLALLWNLRGAHGDDRPLPLGIPVDIVDRVALDAVQQPGVASPFGLAGGACRLTSTSVPFDELQRLAIQHPAMTAVRWERLLTFGPPPARHRGQAAVFTDGRARLEALTESDRETLAMTRRTRKPTMYLDVEVPDAPLPADVTMRGVPYLPSFRGGRAQVRVQPDQLTTAEVSLPSSWASLVAVCRTRELVASPSNAGKAATALIRALGSVGAIRNLMHPALLELLTRLSEREGMSWQKDQINKIRQARQHSGKDTSALDAYEDVLSEPENVVTPPGQGRALGYQRFVQALNSDKAASVWVSWAERHRLLVRGVDVHCPMCGSTPWLPMASLAPPIVCAGCGRSIDAPYEPRSLTFSYRMSEALRRVFEQDCLGHLFALYWFTQTFARGGGLVGAHPGIDFYRRSSPETRIGEADLLLLYQDGSLVPVEVKRAPAGVDARTLDLMDSLADALDAPFDFVAVPTPARDSPNLPAAVTTNRKGPRFLLTGDQLLDSSPLPPTSSRGLFDWAPREAADDVERSTQFVAGLERDDPDRPFDPVREALNPDFWTS